MILLVGTAIVFVVIPGVIGRFVTRVLLRPPEQRWRRVRDVVLAIGLSASTVALAAYVLQGTTDPIVQVNGVETYCPYPSWGMDDPLPPAVLEQCEYQGADRERQALLAASGAAIAAALLVGSVIYFVRRTASAGSVQTATSPGTAAKV